MFLHNPSKKAITLTTSQGIHQLGPDEVKEVKEIGAKHKEELSVLIEIFKLVVLTVEEVAKFLKAKETPVVTPAIVAPVSTLAINIEPAIVAPVSTLAINIEPAIVAPIVIENPLTDDEINSANININTKAKRPNKKGE